MIAAMDDLQSRIARVCAVRARAPLAALLTCLLLSSCAYDIRITGEDINRRLAEKFPVTKTHLHLFKTTFSNPRVALLENTDRLSMGINVAVEMPSRGQQETMLGTATVVSGLAFNSKKGQLFLKDPVIENLSLADAGGRKLEIGGALGAVLQDYLTRVPVYTLKETSIKKYFIRHSIKDVKIKDGAVIVSVGG